jgi:hypothetical protein
MQAERIGKKMKNPSPAVDGRIIERERERRK